MTQDIVDKIELGKATERLLASKDFQKVILEEFMDKQALSIGKTFYGSSEQIELLKSITLLDGFLNQKISEAKMAKRNN